MQDQEKYKEPTSLFEHFIIVGIHPDANLEIVEDAFAKRKKWEVQMEKYEMIDVKLLLPSFSTMEPQVDCLTGCCMDCFFCIIVPHFVCHSHLHVAEV